MIPRARALVAFALMFLFFGAQTPTVPAPTGLEMVKHKPGHKKKKKKHDDDSDTDSDSDTDEPGGDRRRAGIW